MSNKKGKKQSPEKKEEKKGKESLDVMMAKAFGFYKDPIVDLGIKAGKKIIETDAKLKKQIIRHTDKAVKKIIEKQTSVIKEVKNDMKILTQNPSSGTKRLVEKELNMIKTVGKEILNTPRREMQILGMGIGEIYRKNLKNKDKLMEEDIRKWKNSKTLKEKEKHLKNASGKVFTNFKSVYLTLYIANDEVRNFYLEKGKNSKGENLKDPVLYLEKFPDEYKRIMNLKAVKNGFSKELKKIGKGYTGKSRISKRRRKKYF